MIDSKFRKLALVPLLSITGILLASSLSFAQNAVVRVGAPLPLTGPLSPEGVKQKQGYDLWAETANAAGGIKAGGKIYKVEIVYADYASNTPRGVQAAERMITDDKVSLLFSPFGSGATKAASGVSEKYGIPTVAATASSAQVYDQGYKYLFGTFTPNDTLTEPLANIVTKHNANVKKSRSSPATICSRSRSAKRCRSPPGSAISTWSCSRNMPSAPWIMRRRSPRCARDGRIGCLQPDISTT